MGDRQAVKIKRPPEGGQSRLQCAASAAVSCSVLIRCNDEMQLRYPRVSVIATFRSTRDPYRKSAMAAQDSRNDHSVIILVTAYGRRLPNGWRRAR
jgi:hypothetical protein